MVVRGLKETKCQEGQGEGFLRVSNSGEFECNAVREEVGTELEVDDVVKGENNANRDRNQDLGKG